MHLKNIHTGVVKTLEEWKQEAIDFYTYLYYDRPWIQEDFATLADYIKWADERGYFYTDLVEVVDIEEALQDDTVWHLAVAFTQENDSEKVKAIVTEQYEQARVDMSLEEYLFARLDEEGIYMKPAGHFESEAEAEKEGFYWEDEIERWLKLDVNK